MLKKVSYIVVGLCALLLLAGCGSMGTTVTDSADAPVKLSIFAGNAGRVLTENNPVVNELERRTNTKLDINFVADTEQLSKYSILVASGDIPDISYTLRFDCFQFFNQDIYLELDDLIEQYGANLKEVVGDQQYWNYVKYEGKQYAIPIINTAGKQVLAARQDWMDGLGISAPTTLEEYVGMLRAFTKDDPDGNGENDTHGLTTLNSVNSDYLASFTHIFGAFGMQPQMNFIRDGKVHASSISNEYKEALKLIAQLYAEGVIDPESFIHKADQATQKVVQGKNGSFCAWWSTVPSTLMGTLNMGAVDPNARWTKLTAPVGANGDAGYKASSPISLTAAISKNCKNPAEAVKFLDYLASGEGWELINYGILGEHYTEIGARTEQGQKLYTEKTLDVMQGLMINTKKQNENWQKTSPAQWEYVEAAANAPLYQCDMYSIITNDYNTYFPDIKKIEEEWFVKFVTGAASVDGQFSEYITHWKQKGGDIILQSLVDEYNKRNGTDLQAAVQ